MEYSFLDLISKIFYDVSQKNKKDIKFLISEKNRFPTLKFLGRFEVNIPLPKKIENGYGFLGYRFDLTKNSRITMWSLFLASIYHLAAHCAVSNYSIYKKWTNKKTPKVCSKIIDFIEDDAVERYLSATYPDIWKCISALNLALENHYKKSIHEPNINERWINDIKFGHVLLDKIKNEMQYEVLLCFDDAHYQKVLSWANILYKNRHLLPDFAPIYVEDHESVTTMNVIKNDFYFQPDGNFETNVRKLNLLFEEEFDRAEKIKRSAKKNLKGLNFDDVIIPGLDMQKYEKLKDENKRLIKKIRDQIRLVVNNTEDPNANFFGEIDMERAIQAVASNSQNIAEVFDKDEDQRIEEIWTILIDNSASMYLRFKPIREFMLCLSEATDELTGAAGSWSLYCFDQRFSVLKDFRHPYNYDVRARIGGLTAGGLSFTPDAIILAGRLMAQTPASIKHLFVFTDDFPTGIWNFDKKFYLAIKEVEKMGIEVIGISLSGQIKKYFKDYCWAPELKNLVAEFIRIYRSVSSKNL